MGVHYLPTAAGQDTPRARLEAAIEAAIALLDTLDPDPDAEDADEDTEHDGSEPETADGAVEYVSGHDQTTVVAPYRWEM
jgi:hypothetical protein